MDSHPNAVTGDDPNKSGHPIEKEFRLLVQAVTEYAIFRLDPEGQVESWNAGAAKIKGYAEEEIIGRHFSIFYTEDDRAAGVPEEVLEGAVRDGVWTGEGWRVRKDGSRFWAHVTVTALSTEEGGLQGFAKVTRDMTERHEREERLLRREEELRQSERRYRRLFEQAQEGIGFSTRRGDIIDVNPAAQEILGYSREELLSMNAAELYIDPSDREAVAARVEEEGAVRSLELRARHKSGKELIVELSTTPRYGEDGKITGFQTFLRDVTEWKKTQDALRESEEKFRTLAENAPIGISWSQDGSMRYANPAMVRMLGYEPEELGDVDVESLFHPDDWPFAQEQIRKRLDGEVDVVSYQARMQTKSGEARHVQIDAARIGYHGKPTLVGTVRDITEWKKAQAALRRSERRYRRLFEESQEGITISAPDGRIIDANPAVCRMNGYSREELFQLDASSSLYVRPEEREEILRLLREQGRVQGTEVHVRRKDGQEIICQVSATVWRDSEGQVEAIQSFARDVTSERRTREALEESEAKFRALAEESLVGIAIVQDNRFKYVNERFAEIYGYEREELIDTFPGDQLVHPDDRELQREKMRQRIEGEVDAVRFQMRILTKDGRTRRVEVHGRRFTYQGRPAVIGSVLDVTDRIRLQREVLNMQEEERRRLGRDLHDGVASQLTSIALMIGLLSRRLERGQVGIEALPGELEQIEERIKESCDDVRRLARGLAPSGLSRQELPGALERLAQNTEGGQFEGDAEALSPPPDDAAAVQLYWIAQEAITNARKYADADCISIRLLQEEGSLILEIEDDGKGFDPAAVEDGSLGLHTMRYRTELIGGMLTIDTEPGRGTRVCCRISG